MGIPHRCIPRSALQAHSKPFQVRFRRILGPSALFSTSSATFRAVPHLRRPCPTCSTAFQARSKPFHGIPGAFQAFHLHSKPFQGRPALQTRIPSPPHSKIRIASPFQAVPGPFSAYFGSFRAVLHQFRDVPSRSAPPATLPDLFHRIPGTFQAIPRHPRRIPSFSPSFQAIPGPSRIADPHSKPAKLCPLRLVWC